MSSTVRLPVRVPRPLPRESTPRVLVIGNPNTGKTTLFNRLAGTNLRVGNYPGVTVEGASSRVDLDGAATVELVDLPGTYSLSGRSEEERIAINALLGAAGHRAPDAVLVVVDSTQLERSLYLALQIIELSLPTLVLLNMADEAAQRGVDIDLAELEARLGVPCAAVSATTGFGLTDMKAKLARVLAKPERAVSGFRTPLPDDMLETARELAKTLRPLDGRVDAIRSRGPALWALMSGGDGPDPTLTPESARAAESARRALEEAGHDVDEVIANARYAFIDELVADTVTRRASTGPSLTDRIDRVLIHPVWGLILFLVAMTLLFQGLFSWSDPAIRVVEWTFEQVASGMRAALPAGVLEDFLVDGLVAGVGSVLVFLPQILLLFLLIGLMEDSGYMARIAYLMDRIMKSVGLHGRAFVPMLSGFACAVPAILATRTMERKRDRFLTMLVVPLTTCSARLPVYTLIIAALFPPTKVAGIVPAQGMLLAAMYVFSIVIALVAAAVLGRTVLKGGGEPLLLELPPYRRPRWQTVLRMMWDRSRIFVTEAGTVILVCTVILWALLYFPRLDEQALAQVPEEEVATAQLHHSYGARLGKAFEPAIEPLGYDWKIGVGLLGAFAAREVFVATMGVVYGLGDEVDEESATLRERIRAETRADGSPVYTPLVGLSLMIFFALACQCMSTLAAVRRETRSWRWPGFLFVYMTVLAWVVSFFVYQGGRLLGFA